MSRPAIWKYGSLDAGDVGDAVLPTDAKDSSELLLMEPLQTFDVLTIQSTGLICVQKTGEDHGKEDHNFGFPGEATIAEDPI